MCSVSSYFDGAKGIVVGVVGVVARRLILTSRISGGSQIPTH